MTSAPPPVRRSFTPENDYGLHAIVYRTEAGGFIGTITWNPESGTIDNIEVAAHHRRQGWGTRLWGDARTVTPHLRHDDIDELTDDGFHWARAVGGPNAPA